MDGFTLIYIRYSRCRFGFSCARSEPTKLDTTLTVHMRRRTLEEKLEAIRLVEAGNSDLNQENKSAL